MAAQDRYIFRGKVYNIQAGQLVTSETELRKRWGWSRTKVRSFLRLLSEDSVIKVDAKRSKTLITVVHLKLQTTEGQIQEQEKVQKKEQVEIQPKPSDNECKEEICKPYRILDYFCLCKAKNISTFLLYCTIFYEKETIYLRQLVANLLLLCFRNFLYNFSIALCY